jgi:glycosyltransferase involved in cell wall biosynthesis
MRNHFLSVALCSYNGSKYLPDQLESIARQTHLPDELVIVDDNSIDNTIDIVNDFKKNVDIPVHVTINQINLGVTKNFEKAIGLCSGDIIFLSDQDDVWHPDKVELVLAEFSKSPQVGLVFSDADIVDENLHSSNYRLWEHVGFSRVKQLEAANGDLFNLLLNKNYVTGATIAFKSHFRKFIFPIPESFVHDAWIAIIISCISGVAIIPRPLIKYRQHANNQIGAIPERFRQRLLYAITSNKNFFLRQAEQYELVLGRLSTRIDPSLNGLEFNQLIAKISHLKLRAKIRQNLIYRFVLPFKELLNCHYHHFSRGWLSFIRDMFL